MGRTTDQIYKAFVTGGRPGHAASVSHDGVAAYSYRMELARKVEWKGQQLFLINGDSAPSVTTTKHQEMLRGAIGTQPRAFIPYSALRAAGLRPDGVQIVDMTNDRSVDHWEECRHAERCLPKDVGPTDNNSKVIDGKVWHNYPRHFLGECLFKSRVRWRFDEAHERWIMEDRYFVCGLDRNDNPSRRMFFLAQLPERRKPKTVDEALDMLRPKHVPAGTPRQGEWFFLPSAVTKPHRMKDTDWRETLKLPPNAKIAVERVRNDHKATRYATIDAGRNGQKRHYATELYRVVGVVGEKRIERVLVRGLIRDEEHDKLVLPDGWHLAVKNLAVEGWRAGGPGGARVD